MLHHRARQGESHWVVRWSRWVAPLVLALVMALAQAPPLPLALVMALAQALAAAQAAVLALAAAQAVHYRFVCQPWPVWNTAW